MSNPIKQLLTADMRTLGGWVDELDAKELAALTKGGKKAFMAKLKSLAEMAADSKVTTAEPAAATAPKPRPKPPGLADLSGD